MRVVSLGSNDRYTMKTNTPRTDSELRSSQGRLTHHLFALCRRLERERDELEKGYNAVCGSRADAWWDSLDAEKQLELLGRISKGIQTSKELSPK